MDFIERWLHISADGGNGTSEVFIVTSIGIVILIAIAAVRRHDVRRMLPIYLEQLEKREGGDRFDN